MSTTSSPGRLPFGNPALSPPNRPKGLWSFFFVGGMLVFSRIISDGVTVWSWLMPARPVKKIATFTSLSLLLRLIQIKLHASYTEGEGNGTKSFLGKLVGAISEWLVPRAALTSSPDTKFIIAGSVGLVTYFKNLASPGGFLLLNLSFSP